MRSPLTWPKGEYRVGAAAATTTAPHAGQLSGFPSYRRYGASPGRCITRPG